MATRVSTCLWFASEAEEAVEHYVGLVPDSRVTGLSRYGAGGPLPEGTVLTISFELGGRPFTALNGGPHATFNDAHSIIVACDTQEEIDRLWNGLLAGGGAEKQCGWLSDRYGLSWQIIPSRLAELLNDPDQAKSQRVMTAMLGMVKLDIAGLENA